MAEEIKLRCPECYGQILVDRVFETNEFAVCPDEGIDYELFRTEKELYKGMGNFFFEEVDGQQRRIDNYRELIERRKGEDTEGIEEWVYTDRRDPTRVVGYKQITPSLTVYFMLSILTEEDVGE